MRLAEIGGSARRSAVASRIAGSGVRRKDRACYVVVEVLCYAISQKGSLQLSAEARCTTEAS